MAPERCAQYTVAILSESVQAPLVETVYAAFPSVCVTLLSSDVMVLIVDVLYLLLDVKTCLFVVSRS